MSLIHTNGLVLFNAEQCRYSMWTDDVPQSEPLWNVDNLWWLIKNYNQDLNLKIPLMQMD